MASYIKCVKRLIFKSDHLSENDLERETIKEFWVLKTWKQKIFRTKVFGKFFIFWVTTDTVRYNLNFLWCPVIDVHFRAGNVSAKMRLVSKYRYSSETTSPPFSIPVFVGTYFSHMSRVKIPYFGFFPLPLRYALGRLNFSTTCHIYPRCSL